MLGVSYPFAKAGIWFLSFRERVGYKISPWLRVQSVIVVLIDLRKGRENRRKFSHPLFEGKPTFVHKGWAPRRFRNKERAKVGPPAFHSLLARDGLSLLYVQYLRMTRFSCRTRCPSHIRSLFFDGVAMWLSPCLRGEICLSTRVHSR
jgi:hypothetical protein